MNSAMRMLRMVQLAMLVTILVYGVVGEVAGPRAKAVDPAVTYLFTTLAVAIVGMIFVVRRTLVLRSAESLAIHPDDALTLNHWRTGYIATYVLCEALGLLGLVLRFLGYNLQESLPYYAGGFVLLFFFGPKAPQRSPSERPMT